MDHVVESEEQLPAAMLGNMEHIVIYMMEMWIFTHSHAAWLETNPEQLAIGFRKMQYICHDMIMISDVPCNVFIL